MSRTSHHVFVVLGALMLALLFASIAHASPASPPVKQEPAGQPAPGQPDSMQTSALSLTSFPFQAHLQASGQPVNGQCDVKFSLFDALQAGNKVATDRFVANLSVTNGLLNTTLDFGDVFGSSARWLEVAVRCPAGSGAYTTLAPRQEIGWLPRAAVASRVLNLAAAPGDFAANGWLRSIRGSAADPIAGGLELLNTVSGNRWQICTSRDRDELLVGLIDADNNWRHAASFYPNGDLTVVGDLWVNGVFSSTIETRGILRSALGDTSGTSAGTLELGNRFTNNTWQLTTNRDSDSLQWWFGENGTNWRHVSSIEPNGDVLLNYKLHIAGNAFSFLQSPAGIIWQGYDAALGHAGGAGEYSTDAAAGDLVLRADDGKRIVLARGNSAANFPAALTVAASGLVSIPNLQTGGQIEANLQTAQEQEQARIDRFEQGDVLCWDSTTEHTQRCSALASPLVVGIANADGKPLIGGVEPVKVLAPVRTGDLLVAAATPGYAIAWSAGHEGEPPPGSVVAKALETCSAVCTTVRALILFR